MFPSTKLLMAIGAAFLMAATFHAAAQSADTPVRKSEPIYGYRMMNDQERNEYREKMRNARSTEERQTLRDGHRKTMEARAKERGVTLPEPRGPGAAGPRGGMGPDGRGPRGGMGPGSGANSRQGKGPGAGPRPDCPGAADCPGPGAGRGPRTP